MDNKEAGVMISVMERVGFSADTIVSTLREYDKAKKPTPKTTLRVKTFPNMGVGGHVVVFSDIRNVDAHGQWFTAKTDLRHTAYTTYPIYFEHGTSGQRRQIGRVLGLDKDNSGAFIKAAVLFPKETHLMNEAKKGKLFWSTGANPNLYAAKATGELTLWGITEVSVTYSPAGGVKAQSGVSKEKQIERLNNLYRLQVRETFRRFDMAKEAVDAIVAALPDPWT